MKQVLMLIAVSAAISTAAAGQDTRPDTQACRDSATTGMYRRCALWMEGNKVRRGEEGVVVARQGFLVPPHLTRIVTGDSAMAYAHLFERRSNQSMVLLGLGAGAIGVSFAMAECGGQYNGCQYDYGFNSPSFPVLIGGAILTGIGAHFQTRALRAAAKAVWWNNERFAR